MKVVYLPGTTRDLAWFRHYYTSVFPAGDEKAKQQFAVIEKILGANPYVGHRVEGYDAVYEFHIPRIPFSVIYRVTETQIEVLRLWDDRQGGAF